MKFASCFALLSTVLLVAAAHACSVEELRKLADEPLDRLPYSSDHDIDSWKFSTEGGSWKMFERESATPHSIVITYLGEFGQVKDRISFLNRHDFVGVTTEIDYTAPIYDKNWSGKFKVKPSEYVYFCGDKVVFPPDLSAEKQVQMAADAQKFKHHIFEELTMLKPELDRVPDSGP